MGVGGLGKKHEGIEKFRLVVTEYGGIKESTGNIVNNTVTTMCGVRWVLEIPGEHSVKYVIL